MGQTPRPDALDLLTAEHTQLAWLCANFTALCEREASAAEKSAVAEEICRILSIQVQLEEEVFYPAVRPRIAAPALMDRAETGMFAAKDLMAEVCAVAASAPLHRQKMEQLHAMIQRRAQLAQEEIFPKVRHAGLDLARLAVDIQNRKGELLAQGSDIHDRLRREDESADPVGPPVSRAHVSDSQV